MTTPYIPQKRIERAAEALLARYLECSGKTAVPVPVEEILEHHLGLSLGFEDLASVVGETGVLGATWSAKRHVSVDNSLDPDVYPESEGRFRFTLAHEIGHWMLHQSQLLGGSATPTHMLAQNPLRRDRRELQADRFAAALLMPQPLVREQWCEVRVMPLHVGFDPSNEMARRFKVSEVAMRIRLEELGLLDRSEGVGFAG
jgi:hypothetical protein